MSQENGISDSEHNRGIFLVFAQPMSTLPDKEFHDWYNNEHGPARIALPWIHNGYRYHAADALIPEWLATYDVDDMSKFNSPEYKRLLEERSEREQRIINREMDTLDRRFYRLISEHGTVENPPAMTLLLISEYVEEDDVEKLNEYYDKEHTELISKIPAWQRTRRFRLIWPKESDGLIELCAIHEFSSPHGLGGEEHQAARETEWHEQIEAEVVKRRSRRAYQFYYDFSKPPEEQEE